MRNTEQVFKSIAYFIQNNTDEFLHIYTYGMIGIIILLISTMVWYLFNKNSFNKDSDANNFENNISCIEPSSIYSDINKSLKTKLDLSTLHIQWEPLESGGARFKTYKLVKISPLRMELHPTLIWQIFYATLFFLGLFTLLITIAKYNPDNDDFMYIIFSFIFMLISIALFYFQTTYIIFDKNKQIAWKKKKYSKDRTIKKSVPLDDIMALQLLKKKVSLGNFRSFDSFELNFILKSNNRIYVMDYANYHQLKQDTIELSIFLNVPILEK